MQTRQNVRSTKPKPPSTNSIIEQAEESDQPSIDEKPSNNLHISVEPISKLYADYGTIPGTISEW